MGPSREALWRPHRSRGNSPRLAPEMALPLREQKFSSRARRPGIPGSHPPGERCPSGSRPSRRRSCLRHCFGSSRDTGHRLANLTPCPCPSPLPCPLEPRACLGGQGARALSPWGARTPPGGLAQGSVIRLGWAESEGGGKGGLGCGDPDPLSALAWGRRERGPSWGLSRPGAGGGASDSCLGASFFPGAGPAQIGLSTPAPSSSSKGQEAGSPLLSDETSAQGSLSPMKGSLCGAGRPLAKDKTAVCPPSPRRAAPHPRAG